MRGWIARAATNTALRGEEPRNRFARWTARWIAGTPTVPESSFQDVDGTFPGHWRRFPEPWPSVDPAAAEVQDPLVGAIEELPMTWRDVVIARDVSGRDAADVGEQLGLTSRHQRAILNRARALLRQRLDRHFVRDGGG